MPKATSSRPPKLGYTVDIEPGEIIPRGRAITVETEAALAPEAWGGVSVAGQRLAVVADRGGRRARMDTASLAPGAHYQLRVDELWAGRAGKRLPNSALPFFVVDTTAPLPRDAVVRHAARLHIGELEVGRATMVGPCQAGMIDVFKTEHRRTRKAKQLAFDAKGKPVDLDRLQAALERRRLKVFGKLHPTLHSRVQGAKAGSSLPVAVWLHVAEERLGRKPLRTTRRRPAIEHKMRSNWQAATARFAERAQRFGLKVERIDPDAPVLFGRIKASSLHELERAPEVAGIFLHQTAGFEDLADSIAIANADDAHTAGFTGRGINVAVYEEGPDVTTNLSITARYDSSPNTSDHSRHTHGIIKNIERNAPHGHAPDCNLHSANSFDLAAIRWAVEERGCTVISQSFHRDDEQTSSDLSFDDIYKDFLALRWPYPTICEASGNGNTATEFVNHKGFNRLTVGNHNDAANAMSSTSIRRNPTSSHGDRELPEIAANGMGVTAVGLTKSGTSMAAPAVAGGVALIQQANGALTSWPEACRAIMMAAGWRNPTGSTWHQDLVAGVDGADGAGALESNVAVRIARSHRGRNSTPARRGWDAGTVVSSEVDSDGFVTYVYRIGVPRTLWFPTVKVALAWDSKVSTIRFFGLTLPLSSRLTVDLDLHVLDASGNTVAWSGSWDNSYEIAEFAARPGASYEIRIRRWSGSDDVWFGLAWETRGIEFVIERLEAGATLASGAR